MAGVKLQKFLGKAPRVAPELLPDMAAQTATNAKLYSGDLIPYPQPVVVGNHGLSGVTPQTLHALYTPDDREPVWLVWDKDVDIATPSGADNVDEQRFYYTGDGAPKVSTYALATSGAAPYPVDYYDLGLPLPELVPATAAEEFETKTTATYERDAGGLVTMTTAGTPIAITGVTQADPAVVTAEDHGFSTGDEVRISAVDGMVELNDLTFTVTVIDGDTFSLDDTDSTGFTEYDSGGLVALASAPHGLKTGAFVTIGGFTNRSGSYAQAGNTITVTLEGHGLVVGGRVLLRFTSGDAPSNFYTIETVTDDEFTVQAPDSATRSGDVDLDITNLNANAIEITVIDDTTFTYTSPGFQVSTIVSADGRIDLAGNTQARTYLYTWFTPWEEESVGSEPSTELYIKEGQIVTISNLPTDRPAGKNFIRGIRLYRTLSTVRDTEYLRLATLWFPVEVATVGGTTVTTTEPHNLAVGSYFKISTGVAGGEVTDVIDDFTFVYTGGSGSGGAGGMLYHDVSENPGTSTPRYWGEDGYDFVDDFNFASLLNALVTDDYDPPPEGLRGLVEYNNNVLVGFVGNELYFSEPGQYHAWPRAYKKEIPHNIVGLAVFSSYLIVATESYPYLVSGNDPAVLSLTRVDARYPCLNKRSIASMGFGVMYATHDGLALYSTTTGPQLATRMLYNSDTWNEDLDPSTLIATAYKDTYLAWHADGGLSFERDERVGGFFVDLATVEKPEATWYDPLTNKLYYATGSTGDVYLWDDLDQPAQPYVWKSKRIVTANPINIGAAQVDADYAAQSPVWETVGEDWNAFDTDWDTDGGVTFKFWAGGELISTQELDSRQVFRLPSGYISDTFEVSVEGAVRLRAVRLAETPTGLKEV